MDAGGAALDEAFDLLIGPVDAEGFGCFFAGVCEGVFEGLGEFGSAKVTKALGTVEVAGDHQSRDDGAVDACVLALLDKSEVVLILIKELGGDEGGSGIDFLFQVCDVGFEVGGFGVFLGIATDSDFEVWALCLDELNEFIGVVKSFWVWVEVLISFRWVSTQCHDGLDSIGFVVFEDF